MAYQGMSFGLVVVLITFQSSVTFASTTVPYSDFMLLGRVYDYSKCTVGEDIFADADVGRAIQTRVDKADMKFKIVENSEDVMKALDVSGELSVQVMAGAVTVNGKGAYIKSSLHNANSVQVLAQIYYRTVTRTLTDDILPKSGWDRKKLDGRHYIRSITYGAYLTASLMFTANDKSNKEQIKAEIEANMNTAKLQIGVKAQFEQLAKSASSITQLTLTYTSSSIPNIAATDMNSLFQEIDRFPSTVSKSNGGIGVGIEAEIRKLTYLKNDDKLSFVMHSYLGGKMNTLASFYHDLKITLKTLLQLTNKHSKTMTLQQYRLFGRFRGNITRVISTFTLAIGNLDLNGVTGRVDQFNRALDAYKEGDVGFLPGRFYRKLQRLLEENPLSATDTNQIRKYNRNIRKLKNKIARLQRGIATTKLLLSGEQIKIVFPQPNITNFMITKGAPAMKTVMVCFATKTRATGNTHFVSYASAGQDNELIIFQSGSGNVGMTLKSTNVNFPNFNIKNGRWQSLCFYWDSVQGEVIAYKNGRLVKTQVTTVKTQLEAGGTWVVGQDQDAVGRSFDAGQSFSGEITNVNIYANFDVTSFKNDVAPAVSSKGPGSCPLKYNDNILHSWKDFKLGFVGEYANVQRRSCQV